MSLRCIFVKFFKWAYLGLYLFISVLFKHKLYSKNCRCQGIQTQIVGVEGEHADHLTTTMAQDLFICPTGKILPNLVTLSFSYPHFLEGTNTLQYYPPLSLSFSDMGQMFFSLFQDMQQQHKTLLRYYD